ncbi:hypothetical protein [Streptosporangium jomthongense]|uniref:Ricin B lectin domain-containing protein n=1 Tax=Streptosporangium jomthongense TaxID=1193683 RepID=A0ABV8F447_9ACTN
MSHTEHDLRELLAERSTGGHGGGARLEDILTEGRRIRRRRWAAVGTVAAVTAAALVLTPTLLSGGTRDGGTRGGGSIMAQVGEPIKQVGEEGVRLAGVRSEETGKAERLSFVPKSEKTSYRVNCAHASRVFVRYGDRVDVGTCGENERGQEWTAFGSLDGLTAGVSVTVEVFTVPTTIEDTPKDPSPEEQSPKGYDRALADAVRGPALWEIAIHDQGVSSASCSPDICLDNGARLATQGEFNLGGLPNSHQVAGGHLTQINEKHAFQGTVGGKGRVYVRCEGEDLHALIWADNADRTGVLARSAPCGAKPVMWEFFGNGSAEVTVAVVRRDRLPRGGDFGSDLQAASKEADRLLSGLRPEAGSWHVALQQLD